MTRSGYPAIRHDSYHKIGWTEKGTQIEFEGHDKMVNFFTLNFLNFDFWLCVCVCGIMAEERL